MSSHGTTEKKKAVLVTGAAGFIAHHLILSYLADGVPVVGIDNFDPFYSREQKERNLADLHLAARQSGTELTFLPIALEELTTEPFRGHAFSEVVHLAAKAGVRPSLEQPEAYLRANVQGTLRLLEVCRELDVKTFLFGSSSSVYGDDTPVPFREDATAARPISPYAATKRCAELLCHSYAHLYGFKMALLRFFTVYGPRQRPDLAIHKFARLIRDGKTLPLFGDGSTSRDYTFVTDIIAGVRAAARWAERSAPGTCEAFNLGNSSPVPLTRLVELLQTSLRMDPKIEWLPAQPGDVAHTSADISKSARLLGYSPRVPLHEGIPSFVQWFVTTPWG